MRNLGKTLKRVGAKKKRKKKGTKRKKRNRASLLGYVYGERLIADGAGEIPPIHSHFVLQ